MADHDFGDLVILPGLVDSHVHVNEPGRAHWEGFATATQAAIAGGTTTIVDMPLNSIPPTVSVEALEVKRAAAAGKLSADVAFWGGLIPGSGAELRSLAAAGVCGFKSFLVDSGVPEFPAVSVEELEDGLMVMRDLDVPSLLHAEDPAALRPVSGDPTRYASYLVSRPSAGEGNAAELAARLASVTGARVHILHVSAAEAVDVLRRVSGHLTGETCPHYLTFCSEEVPDGATAFKCAPPIRSREHREALWEGLRTGALSMVVSDHSPAPADLKAVGSGDFAEAWGGVGSLQVRLVATWSGAYSRGFGVDHLARWLSLEPARLAGLAHRKGSIQVGSDADLVIFDPEGVTSVRGADLFHRHSITPYEGMELVGRVVAVLLRGQIVISDQGLESGRGRMLNRDD